MTKNDIGLITSNNKDISINGVLISNQAEEEKRNRDS